MTTPDLSEILVAIKSVEMAIQRVDEKLDKLEKSTAEQFTKFEDKTQEHSDVLRKHEVAIRLLEQRQGPKIHPITWFAGIAAVAALGLSLLDRLFVNQ
jgi:hypothetical protein